MEEEEDEDEDGNVGMGSSNGMGVGVGVGQMDFQQSNNTIQGSDLFRTRHKKKMLELGE